MKKRKSWQEKLAATKDLPKTLVIPAPYEVDEMMRQVPQGKLTTIEHIRMALARKHGTTTACPLTTGIFAWIAAHAAQEAATQGQANTTPYWRTLKTGGEVNPKYPGGVARQKKLLRAEGHTVVRCRKQYLVTDYEKSLSTSNGKPTAEPNEASPRRLS